MERCKWKNLENNPIYIEYHDNEWGVPSYDDRYLFEMILLESFHCGLSWLIILKKREHFRQVFDDFVPEIVANYDEAKIQLLLKNKNIIRHEGKIRANIQNAQCFLKIQQEFGSFCKYIWSFTQNKVIYRQNDELFTTNELSDIVSKDLKKRGFKFMGSVTTLSYLEAIGVLHNHTSDCFKHKNE